MKTMTFQMKQHQKDDRSQKRPINHKYLPKQKCLQNSSQIIEVQIIHLYVNHY